MPDRTDCDVRTYVQMRPACASVSFRGDPGPVIGPHPGAHIGPGSGTGYNRAVAVLNPFIVWQSSCHRVDAVQMNRISRLLAPNDVLVNLVVTSKKRLFEQAGLLFENSHGIERGKVFDALLSRERLGSTGLGQGVAIPHGRIKGLEQAVGAVIRVASPVPFDAPDGEPVSLLVFLLVPENATEEHLEILSELAELLSDQQIRESLMKQDDPARIHKILATWKPFRPAA